MDQLNAPGGQALRVKAIRAGPVGKHAVRPDRERIAPDLAAEDRFTHLPGTELGIFRRGRSQRLYDTSTEIVAGHEECERIPAQHHRTLPGDRRLGAEGIESILDPVLD